MSSTPSWTARSRTSASTLWIASPAGIPPPEHELVLGHVVEQRVQVLAAVLLLVLERRADELQGVRGVAQVLEDVGEHDGVRVRRELPGLLEVGDHDLIAPALPPWSESRSN